MRRRQHHSLVEDTDARILWREEMEHNKESQRWLRMKSLTADAFHVIKRLGKGSFGPVKLVKYKYSGNLYAMKTVARRLGLESEQVVKKLNNERTLLMEVNSVWVERMFHSFQDSHYLFLLLEYIPGGSLEELLRQEGTLREYQTKFYGAEMLMAINVIHRHGFMHRNIQPSNFLLDQFGHIKMVDFGSSFRFLPAETCQRLANEASIKHGKPFMSGERRDRVQIYQRKPTEKLLDSIDFKPPEVVRSGNTGLLSHLMPTAPSKGYSFAADFWSFGVCMYYLLFGQHPFFGDTSSEVRDKILNWRKHLGFPIIQPISEEAKDLIKQLLRDEPYRLGLYGCEDVMSHVFFDDVDWMHLRDWPVPVPYTLESEDNGAFDEPPAHIACLWNGTNRASNNDEQTTPVPYSRYKVDDMDMPLGTGRSLVAGPSGKRRPLSYHDSEETDVDLVLTCQFCGTVLTSSISAQSCASCGGVLPPSVSAIQCHKNVANRSEQSIPQISSNKSLFNLSSSTQDHHDFVDDKHIHHWLSTVWDADESESGAADSGMQQGNSQSLENKVLEQLSSQNFRNLSKKKEELEKRTDGTSGNGGRCLLM